MTAADQKEPRPDPDRARRARIALKCFCEKPAFVRKSAAPKAAIIPARSPAILGRSQCLRQGCSHRRASRLLHSGKLANGTIFQRLSAARKAIQNPASIAGIRRAPERLIELPPALLPKKTVVIPNTPASPRNSSPNTASSPTNIQRILDLIGREPTLTELGIFSAMWNEHCSYKSSKVHLRGLPTEAPWVIQGRARMPA